LALQGSRNETPPRRRLCCDEEPGFVPRRAQDRTFVGNIVQGRRLREGRLGPCAIRVDDANRSLPSAPTDDAAVAKARHDVLKAHLNRAQRHRLDQLADAMHDEGDLRAVLQPHRDPQTGNQLWFHGFNQDQQLDQVDFKVLTSVSNRTRLREAHRKVDRYLHPELKSSAASSTKPGAD